MHLGLAVEHAVEHRAEMENFLLANHNVLIEIRDLLKLILKKLPSSRGIISLSDSGARKCSCDDLKTQVNEMQKSLLSLLRRHTRAESNLQLNAAVLAESSLTLKLMALKILEPQDFHIFKK